MLVNLSRGLGEIPWNRLGRLLLGDSRNGVAAAVVVSPLGERKEQTGQGNLLQYFFGVVDVCLLGALAKTGAKTW
jgi:hypothetical protein